MPVRPDAWIVRSGEGDYRVCHREAFERLYTLPEHLETRAEWHRQLKGAGYAFLTAVGAKAGSCCRRRASTTWR